jgi:hypothetical protein
MNSTAASTSAARYQRADFGERVRADQEQHPVARREHGAHAFDGVDRVTGALGFLQPRRMESRVAGAGQFHHPLAMLVRRGAAGGFVRRLAGRDKPHRIQLELFGRFSGHDEMSAMDRIERSAVERQVH